MADKDTTYIDYETFLSSSFSPSTFANSLVLSTNNASDTSLDLSTPLSKTLFDLQEVDTHIHSLTSSSALPLLTHTQTRLSSASNILSTLNTSLEALTSSYARLESEIITRHATAEQVRLAAARLWVTIKIGRGVQRALQLGRQLEAQTAEMRPSLTAPRAGGRDEHRAMLSAAGTLLALRALFAKDGPGEEGEHLGRIAAVGTMRRELVEPSEQRVRSKAQQIVREFSLASIPGQASTSAASQVAGGQRDSSSPSPQSGQNGAAASVGSTYAQTSEMKQRATSALITLYLLSAVPAGGSEKDFTPTLLLTALQTYLHTSLTSSAASLSRALAQLPTLPRALQEVTARCKNVVALEVLLQSTAVPDHPLLTSRKPAAGSTNGVNGTEDRTETDPTEDDANESEASKDNLLTPLLAALDTSSLPSFFWRSLASGMGSKVGDILNRGGAPARTLRSQRDNVRERIREAVLRGCEGARLPDGRGGDNAWEREAAVMVASVVGPLGR